MRKKTKVKKMPKKAISFIMRKPRICIMQPYLLPYIGYYGLVGAVDHFIILDSVQYIRRGWVNRNRLPEPLSADGWLYFGVPVKKTSRETKIQSIEISFADPWQENLKRTLFQKYSNAPHFESALPLLSTLFEPPKLLRDLNFDLLLQFSSYLGLEVEWTLSSNLLLQHASLGALSGSDLILGLCQCVGASTYVNLPGGKELYEEKTFAEAGIDLRFLPALNELPEGLIPKSALQWSILDLVMWRSREEIKGTLALFFRALGQ
jgi:hypothetical protein